MKKVTEKDREELYLKLLKEGKEEKEARYEADQAYRVYNDLYDMEITDEVFESLKMFILGI